MTVDERLDAREGPGAGRTEVAEGRSLPLPGGRRLRVTGRRVLAGVVGLAVVVALTAVLGTAVGSHGGESSSSSTSGADMAVPKPAEAAGIGVGADSAGPAARVAAVPTNSGVAPPTSGDSGAGRPAGVQPRIVWTGSVSVEVLAGAVAPSIRKISAAAQGLGGYLSASQITGTATTSDGVPQSATISIRVPAASFGKLQDAVTSVGTVNSSTTSSQDVTAQYVDLQAREDALTTSRSTYLTLLSKATTIGDILAVQQQIDGVQTQIEQIEGQRKVLADQSDLGTLTIDLTEKGAEVHKPGQENGFVHAFRVAGRSFLRGLEGIISALGVVALIALVGAVLYLLYRLPGRLRRRTSDRAAGATGGRAVPAAPVGAANAKPAEAAGRPVASDDEPSTGTTSGEG
ncbi:DUF4349 domain-containing protein [Pseudofrankia sp. DC12]|uniref:DUF4349 domain-containing protein n=1 Tax=Pseudofrankia sp. DC12 TaxID=683315 RepID=UPI0006965F6B|nr:DUF4349 domain-containing protein [Pseudofrankia sp. DC12]